MKGLQPRVFSAFAVFLFIRLFCFRQSYCNKNVFMQYHRLCSLYFAPACLPVCLPVCLPACLPACLPVCLPACLSACLLQCVCGYLYVLVCVNVCVCVCVYTECLCVFVSGRTHTECVSLTPGPLYLVIPASGWMVTSWNCLQCDFWSNHHQDIQISTFLTGEKEDEISTFFVNALSY